MFALFLDTSLPSFKIQFAINVVVFFLGFSVATLVALKPKKARRDVDGFLRQLRRVINVVKDVSQWDDLERSGLEGMGSQEVTRDLLTRDEVEQQYDLDSWQGRAYDDFKTTLLAKGNGMKTFPCIYATMSLRSKDHMYLFLDSDNPSEPRNIRRIAPALRTYLHTSHSLGPNTSMVIMCAPSENDHHKSVEEYNQQFWEMLRGLRIWDKKPWPREIPQDTEADKWAFCFNGKPVFPVALAPSHSRRWSRHSSIPLIALQPKWVLDHLLGTLEKRESATSKVRKLLQAYDQVDISPDLTSYGAPGTSEIRQLCLLDENKTSQCPYTNFDQ